MSAADAIAFVEKVGFPGVLVFVLLWKVIPTLDEIKKALWALSDDDKTAARLRGPLEAQARHIIEEIGHDTRAALQPLMRRNGE